MTGQGGKRVRIVVEGAEEESYLLALKSLNVFSKKLSVSVKSADSISRVLPVFQNEFSSGKYDLVLVYCDTEGQSIDYKNLKQGLALFFGVKDVSDLLYFGSPETMIVLINHFSLAPQMSIPSDKAAQGRLLRKLGVNFPDKTYQASQAQLEAIHRKITLSNYQTMKMNIAHLPSSDSSLFATNALALWEGLESPSSAWSNALRKKEGLL
jgi:hypothetical protein